MIRSCALTLIAFACLTLLLTLGKDNSSATAKDSRQLPGARLTIDAARYPTLQEAFDALPPEGGVVELPAGTFEITSPLRVAREDVLIRGAGTATHIRNVNTAGEPALVIEPPDLASNPKSMLWRIMLADFRITGNEKSGHGVVARNLNEFYVSGLTVSYNGGDGLHMDYCYEDPRVCDSLITYNKGSGIRLKRCHDIVVASNQLEENQDGVVCTDSFNLCMTGNNLDDHLGDGVIIEYTYGSVLAGNMIEECKGTAVVLDRDCYGITISANVIAHNMAGGVDLRDAHGCAVSANTFTIVKGRAVYVGPKSGRITVSANNFSDSFLGVDGANVRKNAEPATGIFLEGTKDVAISGNVFSGLQSKAVTSIAPSQRVVFNGNVVTEVLGSDHAHLSGVSSDNVDWGE